MARGDSLSALARRYYGNVRDYGRIYDANRAAIGPNPAIIEVGTVLVIPCPDGVEPSAGATAAADPASETPYTTPFKVDGEWFALMGVNDLVALRETGGVQIVDIRPAAEASVGYIPGSISVPFNRWLGTLSKPAGPPADRLLSNVIGRAGIDIAGPIVIVHSAFSDDSFGRAALVYWLLKSAGASRIAILDAGHRGWREAGQPAVPSPSQLRARQVVLDIKEDWVAEQEDVARVTSGEAPGAILEGKGVDLSALGTDVSGPERAAIVLEMLKGMPIDWEHETVITVSSNVFEGATAWFFASEVAGIRNVRLYPSDLAK